IAIHFNAAQELVQAGGDRDFRGCLDAIGELVGKVGAARVIVKETGCGIGPAVLRELAARGVRTADVSGAGGTSWPRVEQLRARDPQARGLGERLRARGTPPAAHITAARAASTGGHSICTGRYPPGLQWCTGLAPRRSVAGVAAAHVRLR